MVLRRNGRATILHLVAAVCTSNHWLNAPSAFVAIDQRQWGSMQLHRFSDGSIATNRQHTNLFQETESSEKKPDFGLQRFQTGDKDFWVQQSELAQEMTASTNKSLRQKQDKKFEERRLALVGDTAYLSFFIFCSLWACFDNPLTALSYTVGALMGLAYTYGLGKSVETLGASIDDVEKVQGAGVGEARFAFLILLFVIVGKFRGDGLQEIPAIAGFFTYQLASLNQGLREIND